ncbi:MAG: glycosyltransferase family protein [Myxococcales bacterium]|jgi:UDP-N-acetylglucosamine transferase subunit ALG13
MGGLRFLFGVHDWGLGHATRDLVLIRALLKAGHEVTVLSASRAMRLLRSELGQECDYVELPDIPKPLSRYPALFYVKMSLSMPLVFATWRREQKLVRSLCAQRRFDRIVSDTRFGVFHPEIPSYFLVHSLRQIIPGRPRGLETMVERHQHKMFSVVRKVLIPDEEENGLAGDLCHNLALDWSDRLAYIGVLSSVRRQSCEQDIDYFITVSGAEPQRTFFEKVVLEQAPRLRGRVVVTLGRPERVPSSVRVGRVSVHTYMNREQQEEMLNRARLVVSRSGYTTLMELAELGRRALFVPTVGQSEQEYLGAHHERQGAMHTVVQSKVDLARDVVAAEAYRGPPKVAGTSTSVERFLSIVCGDGA